MYNQELVLSFGHLLVDRLSAPASGVDQSTLRQHQDKVFEKFQANGCIVGRHTMDDFPRYARAVEIIGKNLRGTYLAGRKGRNLAMCFDPKGSVIAAKTMPMATILSQCWGSRFLTNISLN